MNLDIIYFFIIYVVGSSHAGVNNTYTANEITSPNNIHASSQEENIKINIEYKNSSFKYDSRESIDYNKKQPIDEEMIDKVADKMFKQYSKSSENRDGFDEMNILIVHQLYAGSHTLILRRLGEKFIEAGHKVTQIMFRHNLMKEFKSPVETIVLNVNMTTRRYSYFSDDGVFEVPVDLLWKRSMDILSIPLDVFDVIHAHCDSLLGNEKLKKELKARNFTVAILDMIGNECSMPLLNYLGLPYIGFWGFSILGPEFTEMGIFQVPSVVPMMFSDLSNEMSFFERVYNTLIYSVTYILANHYINIADHYREKYMPEVPCVRQLNKDINGVLVNMHWTFTFPSFLPPNVAFIGGFDLQDQYKPLPANIQDWVSGSGDAGVIVFTLGITGFDASAVPKDMLNALVGAMGRLQQRIIFRFNPELIQNKPDNVLVIKWLPQKDLLADPHIKLLFSNCGQNGINEAIYNAVPIVCLPIFGDQGDNAIKVQKKGIGLFINKYNVTEDNVYDTLSQVLMDPSYKREVTRRSEIWREEGDQGLKSAFLWLKRVHKYKKLKDLELPTRNLNYFQYILLDVMAFSFCVLLLIVYVFYIMFKHLSNSVNRDKPKKD